MDTPPSPDASTDGAPAAEVLKPRVVDNAEITKAVPTTLAASSEAGKKLRRRTYRPSHKATFIAIGVVVVILAINAVVLGFVLKSKNKNDNANTGQVTISESVLNKVGVNKTAIGNSGVQLTIDPDAQFNGKLKTAGDVTIGGQLKLNSKFTANDAALAQLEAGKTSLSELNVSGTTTLSALNMRNNLVVAGSVTIQGATTLNQLLTINNNLNVAGNLAVGGTISTAGFVARNLTSTGTLTIGGHVITSGQIPNFGAGNALGSNGTAAMNGNDSAGTISIAIGVGAVPGLIGNVAFRTQYATIPRIVLTGVGTGAVFYIVNPSIGGFSVYVASALPPGGFAINYIVEQ
jgi:cytoskeletal protein CcmA (bactofilin family)